MSSYDQWLEAPYQERAAREDRIMVIEEELTDAARPLSERLPAGLQARLDELIEDAAIAEDEAQ